MQPVGGVHVATRVSKMPYSSEHADAQPSSTKPSNDAAEHPTEHAAPPVAQAVAVAASSFEAGMSSGTLSSGASH